jgi:hypothetical protein
MNTNLIWIFAGLGAIALIGVFYRMKPGFGPTNLRVVGLVLLATLAGLLAAADSAAVSAAMGIFGSIAGYLFGMKDKDQPSPPTVTGT